MSKFKQIEKALKEQLIGADIVQQLKKLEWLNNCTEISEKAKEVYRALYDARDSDNIARISVQGLADKLLKSNPYTRKYMTELKEIGVLEQYKVHGHLVLYYKFPTHELMFKDKSC